MLGLGTTAGVAAQALLLLPSLRRAGLHLRFRLDWRHEAVRTILRLSGWTFGLVAANQIALLVVLALFNKIPGGISAYTYAYTFFQLPYGVVAISVMSAVTPELAARWARRDPAGFRRRWAGGLRGILAVVLPAAAGELILAKPLVAVLLGYHASSPAATTPTAQALAMLALGLPGFCVFLYTIRAFQAMQDLRTAFLLYVVENAVNVVLAVVLVGPVGVRGVALSISAAYTISAVVALLVLRSRLGGLDWAIVARPFGRVLLATLALVAAAAIGSNLSASESAPGLAGRVVAGAALGIGRLSRRRLFRRRTRAPQPPIASEPQVGRLAVDRGAAAVEPWNRAASASQAAPGPPRTPAVADSTTTAEPCCVRTAEVCGAGDPICERQGGRMPGIQVVTDSACDLPPELVDELGIRVVPLTIRFGDEELVDRVELSAKEFWDRVITGPHMPQTAAPSPGAFQAVFNDAADAGMDGVICINLSSKVSATFQAASTAADSVADRIRVEVVDSLTLTMGLGLLVIEAVELAAFFWQTSTRCWRASRTPPRASRYSAWSTASTSCERAGA